MHKAIVLHRHPSPVKPVELTEREMTKLLQVWCQGKDEVLEADALTLVRWAQTQRLGNLVLEMVLEGKLVPIVKGDAVFVGLPGKPPQEVPGIS